MPRQARLDSPRTLHHVMIRGIEGRNIVDDGEDHRDFVRRLGELATASGTAVFAWALMSNHAHVFLASGVLGLARLMRRLGISLNSASDFVPLRPPVSLIAAGGLSERSDAGVFFIA